jgi:NAD+ kinase
LITNFNIPEKLSAAMRVVERMLGKVEQILIPVNHKERILRSKNHRSEFRYCSYEEIDREAELMIVLGGDGFMLDAARRSALSEIPILGINMGRVGYMTELEIDELELLDKVFSGEYRVDERTLLQAEVRSRSGQNKFSSYALNEAAITNGSAARIVDLELSDGDEVVYTYRADGLLVATPTGSTAYSLSAGGAIITPEVPVFMLTPICAFSMRSRPTVFADDECFTVTIKKGKAAISLDGVPLIALTENTQIRIRKAPFTANFPTSGTTDFFAKVKNKLSE